MVVFFSYCAAQQFPVGDNKEDWLNDWLIKCIYEHKKMNVLIITFVICLAVLVIYPFYFSFLL